MIKKIVGVIMMASIVVILPMNMVPADADPPENVCVLMPNKIDTLECQKSLAHDQHSLLKLRQTGTDRTSPACHYIVEDGDIVGGPFNNHWIFGIVHAPNGDRPNDMCPGGWFFPKNFVSVRGQ